VKREKAVLLIIILLAILTVGAWEVSVAHGTPQNSQNSAASAMPEATNDLSNPVTIDLPLVVHSKVQGHTYTYGGNLWLPNTCDVLSNGMSVQGMDPSHITIKLSVESAQCPTSEKTSADFSVSFTSTSGKAPIVDAVTFNGMEIPYTLAEAK
jgi:hypothetical protein